MPVYEYREGRKTVLRRLPVEERDKYPGRITVPSRLTVCPKGAMTQGEQVLRGFYQCEQRYGTARVRQTEKALGLNHHGVKKAWRQ